MHIMSIAKEEEHAYTAPAGIVNGKLSYEKESAPISAPTSIFK
jgi:hypothetical protein